MIEIHYCKTAGINEATILTLLEHYPAKIQAQITRFHQFNDRKHRLVAREIIRHYFEENDFGCDLNDWRLGKNNKPFIPGASYFNISHSGDLVTVVFSNNPVGIDVEKIQDFDWKERMNFLHPDEREFILAAEEQSQAFLYVWVRKEAYLKAIGSGITDHLKGVCVLGKAIHHDHNTWHMMDINLLSGYYTAICDASEASNKTKENPPKVREFVIKL